MATNTYVALDTQTLTSAAASVTFSSINQGYTDLVIVVNTRTTYSTDNGPRIQLQFNGDTGSNYSATRVYGTGIAAGSNRDTNNTSMTFGYIASSYSSNTALGNHLLHIPNYSNTTTYKTVLARWNATDNAQPVGASVGLWRPSNLATGNITSIVIKNEVGTFVVGSTFTLYGIANSNIGAPKAFGGTITQDANYTYHTFGASGTFTPQQSLTADVLVVAGGGSGGGNQGGGGGAGGLLYQTGRSVSSGAYTVTIGAGGTANGITTGNSGTNSVFDTITALGGGGGGTTAVGVNGGSGGGGGYNGLAGGSSTQGNSGGATGYGNAGSAHDSANNLSGAGGGAGTAGNTSLNSTTSGAGGAGLDTWSSWLQTTGQGVNGYIAGGGGGGNYAPQGRFAGAGGIGGGGAGADTTPSTGTAGRTNTGSGGGGGAGANNAAGAGGSGVVIIRYAN